jgi:uncharacterized protein YegL
MTFGTPTASLTSGGTTILWTFQDPNHTLIGKAGTTTIVTATIANTGAYNVTLNGPIDHSTADQEDTNTFTIPVNVSDGQATTSTTVSVTVEDDSPKAEAVEMSVDTANDTNVMIILDVSGSMNSGSGVQGFDTRLAAAIQAIKDLLDQYDSLGDVRVQIVKFSTGADQVGSNWMSVDDAKDAIENLTAEGSTYYDAALDEAMNIFVFPGKLSGTGVQNVSYFISDGVPTENHAVGGPQQTEWENFLTDNDIVSFALGISDAPTTDDLDPIAFDPAPGETQLADTPKIVNDLNDLADWLVSTASSTSGSLLSGGNSFGADGGYVKSITVDGVTYTFDPTANSITPSGGSGSFTYNTTTKTLTVDTDGSELAVVMTTGAFTFQPTTGFTSESVGFTLTDGDGDMASNTLQLTGNTMPAGIAGSPINLGLTIALDAAARDTHLQLIQNGVTLQGGGQLILSDSAHNLISGSLPGVTLTNVDNTISGAGQLGAMTLVNDGTIVATGFHALVIDTGANVVTNRDARGDRQPDRQRRCREFRIDLGPWRPNHDQRRGHRLRTCDDQWRWDAWIRRRILCRRYLRRGCSGPADARARWGLHRNDIGLFQRRPNRSREYRLCDGFAL